MLAAQYSADLCFGTAELLDVVHEQLARCGAYVIPDRVTRIGAHGAMTSPYLRDADQDLIQLCRYAG